MGIVNNVFFLDSGIVTNAELPKIQPAHVHPTVIQLQPPAVKQLQHPLVQITAIQVVVDIILNKYIG